MPLLRRKTWEGWIRNEEVLGQHAEDVNGWISGINEKLEGVGRPFGHRMAGAIRTYLANYPDVIGIERRDILKQAMADQVQMRILPRLRGLELHEESVVGLMQHLQQLCRENLDDEPLGEALQSRTRSELHQFVWTGFDRPAER